MSYLLGVITGIIFYELGAWLWRKLNTPVDPENCEHGFRARDVANMGDEAPCAKCGTLLKDCPE